MQSVFHVEFLASNKELCRFGDVQSVVVKAGDLEDDVVGTLATFFRRPAHCHGKNAGSVGDIWAAGCNAGKAGPAYFIPSMLAAYETAALDCPRPLGTAPSNG